MFCFNLDIRMEELAELLDPQEASRLIIYFKMYIHLSRNTMDFQDTLLNLKQRSNKIRYTEEKCNSSYERITFIKP